MRVSPLLLSPSLVAISGLPGPAQQTTPTLPTYTAEQRWARSAELGIANHVVNLMQAKARGLTPDAFGQESFKIFGPPRGWVNSTTPFALFRGMYNNLMTHPRQQCMLLEASENLVKAECNRPYAASVRNRTAAYGVTLEEYEASFLAFAQAVAAHHKMTWEEELRLDNRVITIRKP
jgi:hypothetical protein